MAKHTLRIERWQPATVNSWDGRHWRVRAKLKAIDREMVGVYARQQDIPRATTKRRVQFTLILGPRMSGIDVDAPLKSGLDALVACGLLVDDSKEWAEVPPVQYERGPEMATVIELEDI